MRPFAVIALLVLLVAAPARAVGVRVWGESNFHSIELRELQLEKLDIADVPGSGPTRRLPDGRFVECDEPDSSCVVYRSADAGSIQSFVHELRANGWVRGGWSVNAHARVRQVAGGESELWPRSDDEVDLITLYAEYRHRSWALRAGRQWRESALGVANFDGLLAQYGRRNVGARAYAGYSLLRTVNETIDGDALAAIERFAPDEPSRLFGGSVQGRAFERLQLAGAYERELRDDRKGFQSERLALDASTMWGGAIFSGRLQRDLASDRNNELMVSAQSPRYRELAATLGWRRHVPYFEAWTIWNAFSPVGYDEGSARVDWLSTRWPLSVAVSAAKREYDEADTGLQFAPLRDDGWNAGGQFRWRITPRWELGSSYRADIGPGESRSQILSHLEHRRFDRWSVAAFVTAFDYVREYRVSGRTVVGGGLRFDLKLPSRSSVFGSVAHYAHEEEALGPDFGQTRIQVGLRWELGYDPGASR